MFAGDLTHVRAVTKSPYGTIVREWRRKGDILQMQVQIPPNASATIFVPTGELEATQKKIAGMEGVTYLRAEPNYAILYLDSGRYVFHTSMPRMAY